MLLAAGLMWQCAFKSKAEYLNGNIAPAAKFFQNSAVPSLYSNKISQVRGRLYLLSRACVLS
jgi:hypothetical protein